MNQETLEVRRADQRDDGFLWLMLTYAASMEPGGEESVVTAQADPYLRRYVEGWGRPGDHGILALSTHGDPIGAAWIRSDLELAEPGVPELAMAVIPEARGRGIGSMMLNSLVHQATGKYSSMILSVRKASPALRFYMRMGFRRERELRNRAGSISFVMRLPLGPVATE